MNISEKVNKIEVFYDENDVRRVRCFCGKNCMISILNHLKREHSGDWEKWRQDFVRLRNEGWSSKRIMWKYRAVFSWSVIEREIKKIVEEGKASLIPTQKGKIAHWKPRDPSLETTTVWDFPRRGQWATHTSEYRGNWPPQLPRNLIMRYTQEENVIYAPFEGGGTTLIEAYLLRRRSVGVDINPVAIKICRKRIAEMESRIRETELDLDKRYRPIVRLGDARDSLKILGNLGFARNSVDLVCAHPPYLDAIRYTQDVEGDLSHIRDEHIFCDEMQKVAVQLHGLLRKNGICAVLVGDIRKKRKMIPLGFKVMERFLTNDKFVLEEVIIKTQHQDKSTEFYRNKITDNYLLSHEYLLVFRKTGD